MSRDVQSEIKTLVEKYDVVLFMKGSALMPMCGFSASVAGILQSYETKFKHIDVLKDPDIRQGIKSYSDWPTIPQLYIKGEFVGGADIIKELHAKDELAGILPQ